MNKRFKITFVSASLTLIFIVALTVFIKISAENKKHLDVLETYKNSADNSELTNLLANLLTVTLDDENKTYNDSLIINYMDERKVYFSESAWSQYIAYVQEQRKFLEREQKKLSKAMRVTSQKNFMITDIDKSSIEYLYFSKLNSKFNVKLKTKRCLVHYKGDPRDRICFGYGFLVLSFDMTGKEPFDNSDLIKITSWQASIEL
jgi:hypothetical protein